MLYGKFIKDARQWYANNNPQQKTLVNAQIEKRTKDIMDQIPHVLDESKEQRQAMIDHNKAAMMAAHYQATIYNSQLKDMRTRQLSAETMARQNMITISKEALDSWKDQRTHEDRVAHNKLVGEIANLNRIDREAQMNANYELRGYDQLIKAHNAQIYGESEPYIMAGQLARLIGVAGMPGEVTPGCCSNGKT